MTTYDIFAKFYDAVMGDPTEKTALLQGFIDEFRPEAKSVLELACGTGAILKGLGEKYQRFGLDLSERMLEIANRNVPEANLYLGDMSDFTFTTSVAVILCIFDSINHLTEFSLWQSLFQHVQAHLNPNGLFIFDVNTLAKLQKLEHSPPWIREFDGNYLIMKIIDQGNQLYNWRLQIFEKIGNNTYQRHEENILETSFETHKIENAVREHFDVKRVFDPANETVSPASERVYFVCQKGG